LEENTIQELKRIGFCENGGNREHFDVTFGQEYSNNFSRNHNFTDPPTDC
jgi:hypothetical protein